ncbi:MAG TPA: hypothetical protein VFA76_07045 [Terriglobales bacterium]|nr:hypothetical protein [Terriglobales bacterium]
MVLLGVQISVAQQAGANPQQKGPTVRLNVLNVCAPSERDQKDIAAALARIPRKPLWATDFEVDRGRTTLDQESALPGSLTVQGTTPAEHAPREERDTKTPVAHWARIRREFPSESPFLNAQYSFSTDAQNMVETLVFRLRDSKDLLQVSIEDTVSAVSTPATVLATDTPASRVRLERFGKSSIVLARCTASEVGHAVDQSAYEPLFRHASTILALYRDALGARRTIPSELARVNSAFGAFSTSVRVGSKPH